MRGVGSEARPWVRLRLFLADKTSGLGHILLAFHPGHPLSILACALWEDFGNGGWEPNSIVQGMEVTHFAAGGTQRSLLCAGSFSTALSRLNSITSSVSKPTLCVLLPPSSWQGQVWWAAFGLESGMGTLASPARGLLGGEICTLWDLASFWAG